MEFVPRHLYTIPPATGPDSLPGGAVVRRLGPLSPPDHFPACGEMPPGHRQTHHPPERLLPAACRVSASCRAFPSPYRRGRTATRDDAGTHEQLTAGGTPFRMRVAPLAHTVCQSRAGGVSIGGCPNAVRQLVKAAACVG